MNGLSIQAFYRWPSKLETLMQASFKQFTVATQVSFRMPRIQKIQKFYPEKRIIKNDTKNPDGIIEFRGKSRYLQPGRISAVT